MFEFVFNRVYQKHDSRCIKFLIFVAHCIHISLLKQIKVTAFSLSLGPFLSLNTINFLWQRTLLFVVSIMETLPYTAVNKVNPIVVQVPALTLRTFLSLTAQISCKNITPLSREACFFGEWPKNNPIQLKIVFGHVIPLFLIIIDRHICWSKNTMVTEIFRKHIVFNM